MPQCSKYFVFLALGIVAACGGSEEGGATGAEAVGDAGGTTAAAGNPLGLIEPGVLRLGTEPAYPPFEMKAKDGSIIGFDIEIARGFAEKHGLKLEVIASEFEGLIPELQTGRIDMIMSGMSITAERAEVVNFSKPYYEVGQVVMFRKDLEGTIKTATDLNDPKYKIAVQTATTGYFATQKYLPKAEKLPYGSGTESAYAVLRKEADATVFDDPLIRIFASEHPDSVTAILKPFTEEEIGIAVNKKNPALLEAVNAYIDELAGSDKMNDLERDYFIMLTWKALQ